MGVLFSISVMSIIPPICLVYQLSHIMRKPAHLHILISDFVVRCQDSIIPLVSISKISSLYLTSVAAQTGLCLTWSQTPKTGFLVTRLISLSCLSSISFLDS